MAAEKERYEGTITVEFIGIPPVELANIKPEDDQASWLKRLSKATQRRFFSLHHDWEISFDDIVYQDINKEDVDLKGTYVIPRQDQEGKKIMFDGGSIPMPWLVSFLTIGILRPLGVILIGSIVHDYLYKFGHLKRKDGTLVPVDRHIADLILRDIIRTVNELPLVAYFTWFFVRIGWIAVKYDGHELRSGKKPYLEYLILILIIIGIFKLCQILSFGGLIAGFILLYLSFYIISIRYLSAEKNE